MKHLHKIKLLVRLVFAAGILSAAISCTANTPASPPTPISVPTLIPAPTVANQNPLNLSPDQLSQLGEPSGPFVTNRRVVVQRFERGVMLVFAQPGNAFDPRGGGFINSGAGRSATRF